MQKKKNYYLSENIKLLKIHSIWILSNFDNQSVIGLDEQGVTFWKQLENGNVNKKDIDNNEELYNALFELGFLTQNKSNINKRELRITSAYVHLLNRCNLNCVGCYSMNDERNIESDASADKWKLAFERLALAGVKSVVISGGEPLLRKDIIEILQYAKTVAKIENLSLITNGTVDFPFEKLKGYVDAIAVSVDGYSKMSPTFIRDEGIFEKIIKTVSLIRDIGIEVCIVPTLHKKNYNTMKLYDKLAEELQVAISFSIFSVPNNEVFREYILDDVALCKMAQDIVTLNAEVEDITTAGEGICAMKSCGLGQDMISIDSKGNIYPCHILHDENLLLGNIFDNPLKAENFNQTVLNMCRQANVDNIKGCKICEYKYICGGGCRGRAYLQKKNLLEKDSYCKLFYKFHEFEMQTIQQGLINEK
ncbi:radical SAM/SPASM domain-containing protein [Candidatus Galacturonibacter soehngenii]|uniref:Radical SAM protein n=1 Tax=Candidatus Galacturonatibacter soehngenii TaxID=2307010 RepID=A0A7V7QNA5_9FIRM|nr:radical SAM protein [Candidatus Galacturonibacter soehngenii]KAB1440471.1 radical SAM protein [Candidatus Galacturonibacter soehngenii]